MSNGQKNQTPTLNSLLQKPAVMASGQNSTLTTLNPAYSVGPMGNLMANSQFLTNTMVESQNSDGGVGVSVCYAPPNMPDPRWAFARFAGPPNVIDVKPDPNQMKPIVPQFPHSMTPGNFQPMQLRPFIPPAPTAGNPVYYGVEQSYVSQGNFVGPGPPPPQAISTPPMRTSYPMDVQEPQSNGVLPKFKNNPSPSQGQANTNSEQSQLQNAPQHRVVAALRQENSSVSQTNDGRISSPAASSTGGGGGPSSPVAQMRHSPVSPVPVSMYQGPAGYQNCFPSQPVGAMPPGGPQMVFGADNRFKFGSPAPPMVPPGSYQLPYPPYSNPAGGVSVYANGPMPPHSASPSQQQQSALRFRGPLQVPPDQQQPNMPTAGQYRAPMQMAPGPFFSPQPQQSQQLPQHRMPSAFRNANGIVKNLANDDRLCDSSPSVNDFNRSNGRNTPTSVDGRRTSTPASETKKKRGSAKVKMESHPSTPAPNSPGDTSSVMDDLEESSLSSPSWPRTPISPHTSSLRHSTSNNAQQHPTMGPPPPTSVNNNNSTSSMPPMPSTSTTTLATPSTSSKQDNTILNGPALVNRLLGDFRQNPYGSYQEWDERRRFFEHYVQFCDSNNLQLSGHPSVSKQPVDLFRLYKSVKQNGGYVEVTKKKVWREFCGMFNINQSNSASGQLKKQYSKFLLPYECYYDLNKVDPAPIIKACESKKKHKPKNPAAKSNAAQQSSFVGPPTTSSNINNNSASTDGQCPPPPPPPPPISYQQLPNASPSPASYGNQNHPGFPPATPQQQPQPPPTNGPSNEMAVNPFDDCTIRVSQPQQMPQPPTSAQQQQLQQQQQQMQQPQMQQQQLQQQQYQQQNIPPHPSALQYPVRVPNPNYPNTYPPAPPPVGGYPLQPADHRPHFAMPMDAGNYSALDPYQKPQEKSHHNWPDNAAISQQPQPPAGQPQHPPPQHHQQQPPLHQQMLHQQPSVSSGSVPVSAASAANSNHQPYPNFLTTTASPADVVSPPNQYIIPAAMSRPPLPPTSSSYSHPLPPHAVPNPNLEQHLQQYARPQQYPLPSQNNVNHPPVSSSLQPYGQHYPTTVTTLTAIPPSLHPSQSHVAHLATKDGRMQQNFGPNLFSNGQMANSFVRPSAEFINTKQPLSVTSSVAHQHRKDLSSLLSPFPPNSIEATTPKFLKRKKFSSKDIGKVDAWRIVMALKSGLVFETSWALNVLTILLYDDTAVGYFDLKNLPGLFDALIRLFRKSLCDVFDGIDDVDRENCDETYFRADPADLNDQTDTLTKKIHVTPKFIRYVGDFTSISRKGRLVRIEHGSKKRLYDGSIEEEVDAMSSVYKSKRMKFKNSDVDDANSGGNSKIKTLFNDDIDSDEVLTRLAPPVVDDRIENVHRKSLHVCLATSNIIRALSFIPGNDCYIANTRWSTLINAEAKLLTYVHRHIEKRKSKHHQLSSSVEVIEAMDQSTSSSTDDKIEEPVELDDNLWYYTDLLTLADDALVVLSNVSANLDLYEYDERTVEILLSAVIHWAVCKAPIASDPLPNAGIDATPPYRCALEILCKLSVFERNVDLILATPPWSRIETLVERLASFVSLAEDVILREFAVVLLHAFCNLSPVVCVVAALKTPAVSNLLCFLEFADSEMHRVLQYHGMAALRDNPEIIGTSVGMLRRASSILLAVSKIPSCGVKFIGCEMRLINLTMSQLMDSRVGSTIAEVLYELQKENETGSFNVVVYNQPGTLGVGVVGAESTSNCSRHNKNSTELT